MEKLKLSYKHILLIPLVLIVILLAELFVPMIFNLMRRPAPMVRAHVLRITPIGTYIDEVFEIIESNVRWGSPSVSREGGFSHSMIDATGWQADELREGFIIGNKSIWTFTRINSPWILHFVLISHRNLTILWGFDEDGKLIEVNVRSTYSM